MHRSAAVLCEDPASLQTLTKVLSQMGIDSVSCHSQQEALEQVLAKHCEALVVDFDLPGAADLAKLAALLEPQQKPALLAMTGAWPGNGQAFQSGANRILYKPLQPVQIKDAFEITRKTGKRDARRSPRYKIACVVWLEMDTATLPAVGINLSEHGMAVRATERLKPRMNVLFHCRLPGTTNLLHGRADLMWADESGRAGMFFSRLAPSVRKHLKDWLRKRRHSDEYGPAGVRDLMQPEDSEN